MHRAGARFGDFEGLHPRGARGRFVGKEVTARGEPALCAAGHDYSCYGVPPGEGALERGIAGSPPAEQALAFGMDLTQPPVRALLGACAGASSPLERVHFDVYGGGQLVVRASGAGFTSEITLRRPPAAADPSGKLIARLELMRNDAALSGRSGAEIFANQVRSLRRAGVGHLFLDARGSLQDPDGFNGYYVWPRLGCEAELTGEQVRRLPAAWRKQLGSSRSLQDLFSLGGGDAWKTHGEDVYCWFDLSPQSRNTRNLERYLDSRRADFAQGGPLWTWHLSRVCFTRRREGGWTPYVPKRGHDAGRPMERNPATGSVREAEPAGEPPFAIPASQDAIPYAQLAPERTPPPTWRAAAQMRERIAGCTRGRRLFQEVYSCAEYHHLLACRGRVRSALEDLKASVAGRIGAANDRLRARGASESDVARTQDERAEQMGRRLDPRAGSRLDDACALLRQSEERFRDLLWRRLAGRFAHGDVGLAGRTPDSEAPSAGTAARASLAARMAGSVAARLPGEPPLPSPALRFVPAGQGVGLGGKSGLTLLASYDAALGVISVPSSGMPTGTMLHELGHHLELHLPGASEACRAFYEMRRGREPLRSIRDVAPDSYGSADPSVVGIGDDFARVFHDEAAYVGRYYHGLEGFPGDVDAMRAAGYAAMDRVPDQTELLSHGLQYLWEKPHRFEADPEYFSFLVGVLDGSLRRPIPAPPHPPGRAS